MKRTQEIKITPCATHGIKNVFTSKRGNLMCALCDTMIIRGGATAAAQNLARDNYFRKNSPKIAAAKKARAGRIISHEESYDVNGNIQFTPDVD